MTLKEIIEDKFRSLLRSVDPSCDLLGGLRSVPFIKDRISAIRQQLTVHDKNDALLSALLEVPDDTQELVINGFIAALRLCGQDHVANVLRRENDKIIMSDEHYDLLSTNRPSLCNYMNARDGLVNSLVSSEIFSETDIQKISCKAGLNDMADETIGVLLRKSDDVFGKLVNLLRETGQSHVAYILTGEGNSRPLKEEHRRLLSRSNYYLVNMIDSKYSGLTAALVSKGVFSSYDEQQVTNVQPDTCEIRNEMMLNLIARKSQSSLVRF